jgi:hypothetical protein
MKGFGLQSGTFFVFPAVAGKPAAYKVIDWRAGFIA